MIQSRPSRARRNASTADSPFASRSTLLALEPRTLFDGAAAVVADKVADQASAQQGGHHDTPADIQPRTVSDAGKATPDQQQAAPRHEVLFVDSTVDGWQNIVANVQPNIQVVVLDGQKDPLQQIADTLSAEGKVDAVHIISHGAAGSLQIGGTSIDLTSLSGYASQLATIGSHLTENGDILLYGCDIGEGAGGEQFVAALAQATHADVAASTDATGAAAKGGDWVLEYQVGHIESTVIQADAFTGLLVSASVTGSMKDSSVVEPSELNTSGASELALTGWVIAGDGMGTDQVTVQVTLSDTAAGTLSDAGGHGTALANGFQFTGTAADATAWVNQLKFSAADTELGNTAATTGLTVKVADVDTPTTFSEKTIQLTVTPSNDPTRFSTGAGDGQQSVNEIGNTTITGLTGSSSDSAALHIIDPEVSVGTQSNSQIIYRLTDAPDHGYLTLNGVRLGVGSIFTQADVLANKLVYVHTATGTDQNDADTFTVSVNDGATPQDKSVTQTVTLNITPVNQAPVITGSDGSVFEGQPNNAKSSDGTLLSTVGNFIEANGGGDPNDAVLEVAITSLTAHGTLHYSGQATIGGTTQTIDRDLTQADIDSGFVINYADRGGLTYSNDGIDVAGLPPNDAFGIRVTDGGGNAGASAAKSIDGIVNITVRPVDDDPTFVESSSLQATVEANGADHSAGTPDDYRVTLTSDMLQATDVDSSDGQITFVVTQLPGSGQLLLNDGVLAVGATFTMDDVRNGRVQYLQTAMGSDGNPTDVFHFQVQDNALAVHWDAEGNSYTRPGGVYAADAGAGAALTTFAFTVNLVKDVTPTGTAPAGADHSSTPAPDTSITTTHAGDDPNPGGVPVGELIEGGSITLWGDDGNSATPIMLNYTAEGIPSTQVVYTIEGFANGWSGQLLKNGVAMDVYSTFTQDDLNNGRITYQHDGSENFQSTVTLRVAAGGGQDADALFTNDINFTFYITPVNDAPDAHGSSDTVIAEGGSVNITTGMLSFSDPDDANSGPIYENGAFDGSLPVDGADANFAINNGAGGSNPLQFIIAALPQHGTLEYLKAGVWTAITQSDLDSGTFVLDASLLTAGGSTGLRYIHDGSESSADSFQVRAIDNRGVTSDLATVGIQITAVNDGPQIAKDPTQADPSGTSPNVIGPDGDTDKTSVNEPLTVVEEGGFKQITSDMLLAYDPDSTSEQVQYRVTTAPASGRLAYSVDGVHFTTIGVGASFSQKDVNEGHIYYINDGTEPDSAGYPSAPDDKFVFTVADGDKEQSGNEFWIYVKPTNDAPVVTAPDGPIIIDSASSAHNPVSGFSVHDVDLDSVLAGVETDFVQVTVRLLDKDGNAFSLSQYSDVTISYAGGSGVTVDADHGGAHDFLTLRGTQAQINAALAGLAVTFGDDHDAIYQVQVIADDRVRDVASGDLIDTDISTSGIQPEANGGPLNQALPGPGEPTAVPATEHDWYTEAVVADDPNIGAKSVIIWASVVNDPAVFTGPATKDVVEDQATFIGGNFVVADPESAAFGTTVKVTLSVPNGTLIIGSGAGVVGSGSGTGTITLTGTAQAIQDLLNDSTNGLKYQSPTDGNHDYNGAGVDGDVTLTVKFDDAGSAIGDDTGSGSQPNNPPDITVALTIKPVNDAPTVTAGSDIVIMNGTTAVEVHGISVSDKDIGGDGDGGTPAAGETDFIQVTVRLLQQTDGSWVPVASGDYSGVVLDSNQAGSSSLKDGTYDGAGTALVIRGTLAEVNGFLAKLTVSISGALANKDATYRLEIIADDRVRDADGDLVGTSANGGENNNAAGGTQAVPTTAIDPYAAIPGNLGDNVSSATRDLFPTDVNDPAEVKVTDPSVNEGSGTYALSGIVITDSDALDGELTVTVTLPSGFTFASQGSGADIQSGSTANSVIIKGTLAEINAHVNSMTVQLPDAAGTPDAADWNGTFEVTVVVNDGGNNGGRPGSLDSHSSSDDPGSFSYADGTSNVLVTTRVYTVTVAPVNDAPVVIGGNSTDFGSVDEGGTSTAKTVDDLFGSHFSDERDVVDNSALGNGDGSDVGAGTSGDAFWGVAIVGYTPNAAQGVWEYSLNGTDWTAVGTRTTSTALVLDKTVQLRFVAANDFHGTPSTLTVALVETDTGSNNDSSTADPVSNGQVDLSGTGARGSQSIYSADSVVLGITVNNLNDSPVLTGSSTLATVAEDTTNPGGATVSTLFGGQYSDVTDNQGSGGANIAGGGNAATSLGGVAIVGNTADSSTQGTWEYSTDGGAHWQSVGVVSDSSALVLGTSDMLRFVPSANYTGTPPSLDVRAADTVQAHATGVDLDLTSDGSGNESTWSDASVLTTYVAPRNDAPVLTGSVNETDSGNPGVIAVTENNDTGSGLSVPDTKLLSGAAISDLDLGSTHDAANADILDSSIFGAGSVTVKFTDGYVAGDILSVDAAILAANGATLDTTFNGQGKDLRINFSSTTTVAQVNAVLNALSYRSSSDNPTDYGGRTERNFSVVVNDGRNDQGSGKTAGVNPDGSSTTGLDSNAITGVIAITATNDPPLAVDDTHAITENTTTPISGNVITGAGSPNTTPDSDPDNVVGDLSISGVRTGTEAAGGTMTDVVNGTDTIVAGKYGTLTIKADGSYSYALDNSNSTVNALKDGQSLTDETFSYTLRDTDGLTDVAQLTITIHGKTDGAPQISPVDGNGATDGQVTVHESGLFDHDDSQTNTGSVSITAADGLASIDVGGTTVSLTELRALDPANSATWITITTSKGEITLTGFTETTLVGGVTTEGSLAYSYTLTHAQNTPSADSNADAIALGITDAGGGTATGTLTVHIVDDTPTADVDTNSVTEDSGVAATGNVFTNDRIGADGAASPGPVTGVVHGVTSGTVGSALAGTYGSLTLNADGSYSYALDDTNPTVNALKSSSTPLTETFSYTITDGDGDTSTATLTITIHGNTDGAPQISPVDGNGATDGQVTVHESGLFDHDDSQTNTGSVSITAADGLASISVGGITVSLAQLGALGTTPITIDTDQGRITLTSFTPSTSVGGVPTAGTLAYSYTLTEVQNTPSADGNTESIDLGITDAGGGTATGTLTVHIVDDTPTARSDTADVDEGTTTAPSTISGNVVTGSANAGDVADRIGADANASPVTGVVFGSTVGTVGSALDGAYGSLTLNADGSYSYSLDNTKPVVNALKDGETLTETFSYTITDGDGDTSSATLTITIHGKTDGAPQIAPVDGNGATDGQVTVHESGLFDHDDSQTNTGSVSITAADGLASIDVGGTTVSLTELRALDPANSATWITITTTKGEITLTGFTETTSVGGVTTEGSLAYSYTLTHAQNTPSADSNADAIALGIIDAGGGTATGTLTVHIVDDTPTADVDTNSVTEDSGVAATGNVFTNDRIGADDAATPGPVTGVVHGVTSGTVGSALAGTYGSLTLNADGSYSYALDDTNPTVNALKSSSTPLTETFSYTITDGDGDTSTATLTITIHGNTDGAPQIAPVDGNGATDGQVTVHESGLADSDGSQTNTGSVTITAADGLASISVGGQTITVDQLLNLGTTPISAIVTADGTITITGFTPATTVGGVPTEGTLTYSYTLTQAQDTPGAVDSTVSVALGITDAGGGTATGTLTVHIVDDTPTADVDTNSVTEDSGVAATGNVFTNDRIGADGAATPGPVTGVVHGVTSGTVGSALAGTYGSLTLNADGSYSYALDDTNPTVNALKSSSTPLTETFSYTITDGDGDTSTATLTITIHGNTDGAPQIAPVDGNGATDGQVTVHESGLADNDGSQTNTGSVSITAADGLTSIDVGGTTVSLTELRALDPANSATWITITTTKGEITLTGFTETTSVGGVATAGTLAYSYTLTQVQNTPGADSNADDIDLGITDAGGGTATGTLTVHIVDDTPTARSDTADVDEGTTTAPSTISGNVVTGSANAGDVADRIGADANASPVTGVVFGSTVGTVGSALDGAYGSLTLNADGSYSYSLDNTKPVVNALKDGETLTETFSYTITDGDGDTSSATLTITIHGVTDGTLTITPDDGNGAADGHVTVFESGLVDGDGSQTNTGTIAVNVPDGLTSIDVGGTTVDLAELRGLNPADPGTWITITTPKGEISLTGFTEIASVGGVPTEGSLAYSYTLTQVQDTPAADGNTDSIDLGILDAGGGTATGTLDVHIADDTPTAYADTDSVTEDSGVAATGNVFANDRIGADGAATSGPVTDVTYGGTPGTVGGALAGAYGTLTLNADGSYSYVVDDANPAVNGLSVGKTLTETFSYTITDHDGDTSTSTLTITIRGANDAPVTVGTLPNVHQDDSTVVKVPTAGGFTDVDTSDTLTYTATNLPPGLSIDKNTGEITGTLTHDASQGGPDRDGVYHITVTADDGNGGSVTQTFTFTVTNPPPEAHPDTGAVDADSTLTAGSGAGVISGSVTGAGKDVDIDGDPITVIGVVTGTASDVAGVGTGHVGAPLVGTHGTLVLNVDGSYSYSADQPAAKALKAGETATDVFTYAISDGNGGTSYTTLSITVTGIARAIPTPPASDPGGFIYTASDSSSAGRNTSLVTDPPHIWEMGGREQRVINLASPMHPVVYVEVTVQSEQAMREESDLLGMGADLDAVLFREPDLSENSRDLGMDPVIFVRPAVNLAQREQLLMRARTLGRDGRTSLSADNLLGNNSIFALDKGLHLFHGGQAPARSGQGDEHTPAQNAHAKPRGAASFTSQLRQADPSRPAASNSRATAPAGLPSRTASLIPTSN